MTDAVLIERLGDVAVVTVAHAPVNALARAVRAGLIHALHETAAMDGLRAVVLTGRGRSFIAGADIHEFALEPEPPSLPEVIAAIEGAPVPWVAAINGTCLGGGMEVALACHARVAAPGAKLGFPEVNLGLIPGAGGTVRLPRLVAPEAALDLIVSGRPVDAARAAEIGLIDAVAQGDVVAAARAQVPEAAVPLIGRPAMAPGPDWADRCAAATARAGGRHAQAAAVAAVDRATRLSADAALAAERAAFVELKAGAQSAALRHVFFAERAVSRLPTPQTVAWPEFQRIGIVGAGTMGAGIAAACLLSGLEVILLERDESSLVAGCGRVEVILDGAMDRGKLDQKGHARAMARLSCATQIGALTEADLVIEAVFEDMGVKRDVFAALDEVMPKGTVLATNTSYLDVGRIAEATADPARVIGLHFFSPAHVMKLVEVVVPPRAAPKAIAAGLALAKRLGKTAVPTGVCDGFIGNRVMSAYRRAADVMMMDGTPPWDIDRAMRDFGFPMGVYEMQDLAGLDIGQAARRRRAAEGAAPGPADAVADALIAAGRLGRKTGAGWYRHGPGGAEPDPEVEQMIARHGGGDARLDGDAIMERILTAMQEEGRALVSEGIAADPDAVDVVMILGYGFPRWKGGPMWMAAQA
ncbi:3-hydroxyacyl-CoA dehydrogenase [Rhodobacteraceae bacterium CCMM004]|nr:3-hydroxyacyl-CoA dehydrogenase [Rhodobacteraceae bacterium CCMM004]